MATRPFRVYVSYVFAVAVTVAMFGVRVALDSWFGDRPGLINFMFPIMLSAYVGGLGPGLLATALTALGADYFLLRPFHSFSIAKTNDLTAWVTLIVNGIMISALLEAVHRERRPDKQAPASSIAAVEWKIRAGFAVALAILVAISALSYYSIDQERESAAVVRRARLTIDATRALMAAIRDVETGVGRFVITGMESQLLQYKTAANTVHLEFEKLRGMVADEPTQLGHLDTLAPLVARRIAIAEEVIALRRRGFEPARTAIAEGEGKRLLDEIRNAVAEMEKAENTVARERRARVERYAYMARFTILVGGTFAFAFTLVAIFVIGRDFAGRRHADAALREAHDTLETRVRERTGELKRSYDMLRERTAELEQLAAIVESSEDAIIGKTLNSVITSWNAGAENMFGYSRQEAVGRPMAMIFPPDRLDEEPKIIARIVQGERIDHFETVRLRRDGKLIDVAVTISPIRDSGGRIVGASKIARDISARRQADEALRARDAALAADRLKSEFLAGMSHELRTPMNAIIGFTGTLLMKLPGPLNADQEKQLRTIQSSSKHLLSLINDLLDLAKVESGKTELYFEWVVCQSIVDEVAAVLRPEAERKGLVFEITMPKTELVIQTDRRALHQIILNLANNAVKFTDRGGVHLTLGERKAELKRAIEIKVKDTGAGIRAEEQAKLFQPFTQVDISGGRLHEGTGLGLHLSQKLAVLLGGKITFESEYGKGSLFTLTLEES